MNFKIILPAFIILASLIAGCRSDDLYETVSKNTWVKVEPITVFSPRFGFSLTSFNNKIWLIGGQDKEGKKNDIWFTEDGISWVPVIDSAGFSPRRYHQATVFNNKLWLIGGRSDKGNNNDIWFSESGKNWELATDSPDFLPRQLFETVVYENKFWLAGGSAGSGIKLNDVWSSTDGIFWKLVTDSTSISPRFALKISVFEGSMWLAGGCEGNGMTGNKNDIWRSNEGINWTRVKENAVFNPRHLHAMFNYRNSLIIIGGDSDYINEKPQPLNDLWISGDGTSWREVTSRGVYPPRSNFNSIIHDGKIWIVGGVDSTYKNDIWYLDLN